MSRTAFNVDPVAVNIVVDRIDHLASYDNKRKILKLLRQWQAVRMVGAHGLNPSELQVIIDVITAKLPAPWWRRLVERIRHVMVRAVSR